MEGSGPGATLLFHNEPVTRAQFLPELIQDVMKRLLRDAQIPIAEYIMIRKGQTVVASEVFKKLGATVFVKPANMGSSVGVSKAKTESQERFSAKECRLSRTSQLHQ
jgi:D-alanine-D-alanine ligase-like ATP-grasp enzyme